MTSNSELRIAAITNLYPTAADRSQGAFIEQQVKGLEAAGVEVRVSHLDRRAQGVQVYRRAACLLEELRRSFSPHVIHVMYGGVLADRVTRARPDAPVLVSFCGSDLFGEVGAGLGRKLAGAYGVRASQRAAKRADGVIVKSAGLRNALDAGVDRARVWILPNGVDLERFRPLDRMECRRRMGWNPGGFHVLFTNGQGRGCKRLELAEAAVRELRASGVAAELHVLPGVPQEQVPAWLNAADAFILTSAHEGSPNIVKEALACNRPVVSVDVGDVRERIAGVEGCHVAEADPECLAAALRRVWLEHPETDGRSAIRELSLESVSKRLAGIYEEVRARHARERAPAAPFRRWLILSQYYAPEPGAPQIRLRALSKELTRRGCEVEVLTALPNYPTGSVFPEYRGRLFATEKIDGVTVRRLPLYPAAGRKSLRRILCYMSFSAAAALRLPWIRKPDVVFVEAQPITLAIAAYLTKLLRGTAFIYNTPDLQVEIAGDSRWVSWNPLVKCAAGVESFLMRQAACVSTVTEAFIEHFVSARHIDRARLTFLPNGADVEALRPLPPDEEYADTLGVAGKKVFTYAGTHAPYQGLELLIETAEHLKDRADIAILMVGRGPLRAELQQRAKDLGLTNVLFRESPFSEMARLMSVTRASLATIAPMSAAPKMRLSKVVPPLACGVPVLYAGEGEWEAILRQHGCGRTVERSAVQLAAAIREMADAPAMCREMGQRGRHFVEAELSWTAIVERWLAQVNALSGGAGGFRLGSKGQAARTAPREGPLREFAERVAAAFLLALLLPLLLAEALCILVESGGPVLFRQTRIGRYGRPFTLLKLRSMRPAAGTQITAGGDLRVTRVGRFLRKYKLDELPQLWNIVAGSMTFIGPRPDLPAFIDLQDPAWSEVLQRKPGLADLASLAYRYEEQILARYSDPERGYRDEVLPAKLALSVQYSRNRSFRTDFKLALLTARYSFLPGQLDPERIKQMFVKES